MPALEGNVGGKMETTVLDQKFLKSEKKEKNTMFDFPFTLSIKTSFPASSQIL